MIPKDTTDDIETAVQAAKYLESEGVSILVGPLFASQAKAVQENLTSNLPIFSFTNDESISKWHKKLAQLGILIEPTCAAVIAGVEKLCKKGVLTNNSKVLVPLTGSGLKDLKSFDI